MHEFKIKNPKLFIQQSFDDKSKLEVFSINILSWSTESPNDIDLNEYKGGKIIVTSPHGGRYFMLGGEYLKEAKSPCFEIKIRNF